MTDSTTPVASSVETTTELEKKDACCLASSAASSSSSSSSSSSCSSLSLVASEQQPVHSSSPPKETSKSGSDVHQQSDDEQKQQQALATKDTQEQATDTSYFAQFKTWLGSIRAPDVHTDLVHTESRFRPFWVEVGTYKRVDDYAYEKECYYRLTVEGLVHLDEDDASVMDDNDLRLAIGSILVNEYGYDGYRVVFRSTQDSFFPFDAEEWAKEVHLDIQSPDLTRLIPYGTEGCNSKFWMRMDESPIFYYWD